jgi:putative heme-binding domain-containing protein
MGRIYRVVPEKTPARPMVRLDRLDTPGLVAALETTNGWQRDMVQQMLLWRGDRTAQAPLEKLARESQLPHARLHALCTLEGLGLLDVRLLQSALVDPHPGVRMAAIRLCEGFAGQGDESQLLPVLKKLTEDAEPTVRLQLACSLGAMNHADAAAILAMLARRAGDDPYQRAAVLSSLKSENLQTVLEQILMDSGAGQGIGQGEGLLPAVLTTAVAIGKRETVSRALESLASPRQGKWQGGQFVAVAAILEAVDRRRDNAAIDLDAAALAALRTLTAEAQRQAASADASDEARAAAARLLGRDPAQLKRDRETLLALLTPRHSTAVQIAAVNSLARSPNDDLPEMLLRDWNGHSPNLRAAILDLLMSREAWAGSLLDRIEQQNAPANLLDARRRQQLLTHKSEALRERASRLLESATASNRQEIVAKYLAAKTEPADAERGRTVYEKRCAVCHRLNDRGHAVGPDLAALAGKPIDALTVAILDPNRAIEDRYLDYVLVTEDGRSLSGILAAETGASVTLLGQESKATTVLRHEIDTLKATGKSLMPEGLEKDLSPQDIVDVIAYLRQHALPPKAFPGNQPETVRAEDSGALKLLATNARIYGPSLVFEEQYRNLGYWQSPDDRAVWTIDVRQPGKYRCVIDYASHVDMSGDRYAITIGDQTLGGIVRSTGDWDQYRTAEVGVVELKKGETQLEIRSAGPVKGAMIDLRGIWLYPAR